MSRSKSITLWYPEYPGDYARKTGHLSMSQHGAYLLLRQHYYSTGRPLPTNVTALYRVCGAVEDAEKDDVKAVLAEFFTLEPDGYHNSRCDEELAKRSDIRTKRQAAVNSRKDRRPTNEPTNVPTPTPTPTDLGGGGRAREQHAGEPSPHEQILAAIGIVDVTTKWHSPAAIATTDRWLTALSLAEALPEIEAIMRGRTGPPGSLAYFDPAMQRAVDRKASPPTPLKPIPATPAPEGQDHARRSPARNRSTEALEAFVSGAGRLR